MDGEGSGGRKGVAVDATVEAVAAAEVDTATVVDEVAADVAAAAVAAFAAFFWRCRVRFDVTGL